MDVPAEVIFAEGEIEFGAGVNDVVESVQAEGFGFAELAFKVAVFDAVAEGPDGIDEGKSGEFEPGGAEVQDLMGRRTAWSRDNMPSCEIDGLVAD